MDDDEEMPTDPYIDMVAGLDQIIANMPLIMRLTKEWYMAALTVGFTADQALAIASDQMRAIQGSK